MKKIFVITEGTEIITSRDTMDHAIAAAIRRIAICGYLLEEFIYDECLTIIQYRDLDLHETREMIIQEVNFKEGV